jgi:hypothetical protein
LDLDPSSDYDNILMSKGKNEMNKLKEMEISNAIFLPVEEDIFFSLD